MQEYKTWLMKYLEKEHGQSIEELMTGGTLAEVAKRLSIDVATASRWRERLELVAEIKQLQEAAKQ